MKRVPEFPMLKRGNTRKDPNTNKGKCKAFFPLVEKANYTIIIALFHLPQPTMCSQRVNNMCQGLQYVQRACLVPILSRDQI